MPSNIILMIDTSGSMGCPVGAVDGVESNFSRMDLLKHSARTIVGMLNENDTISIVKFSTAATILLNPTKMNETNKGLVNRVIDSLIPDASTNIYDAIQKSIEIVTRSENLSSNYTALLLTDGYPNINPPRGILETLKAKPTNLTMYTFGFGYDIDSKLLYDLSMYGNGGFGFIPDCTMVGTVFINAMAHILTKDVISHLIDNDPIEPIMDIPAVGGAGTATPTDEFIIFHSEYLEALHQSIEAMNKSADSAISHLTTLYEKYKDSSNMKIKEVLKDIVSTNENEGQIGMAPKYAAKWGLHYTRAYTRAQALQYTMNFKDPGLQIYSNHVFSQMQAIGDDLFVSLPPPVGSITSYGGTGYSTASAGVASMAMFHNASGGCFAPHCMVKMGDNSYKQIQNIHPDIDYVWTPSGPAKVVALVKIGSSNPYQPMSNINKLWITPYHPILFEGRWRFPADIAFYCDRLMPVVYNLVLESGHIIDVNDFLCPTLGHGLTEDLVKHDYFGTHKVIDDLKKLPGWAFGRPTFTNLKAIKNAEGVICEWVDDV